MMFYDKFTRIKTLTVKSERNSKIGVGLCMCMSWSMASSHVLFGTLLSVSSAPTTVFVRFYRGNNQLAIVSKSPYSGNHYQKPGDIFRTNRLSGLTVAHARTFPIKSPSQYVSRNDDLEYKRKLIATKNKLPPLSTEPDSPRGSDTLSAITEVSFVLPTTTTILPISLISLKQYLIKFFMKRTRVANLVMALIHKPEPVMKSLKAYNGNPYTTTIMLSTSVDQINDAKLIIELIKRELIKVGSENTIPIKVQPDSIYYLGGSKHDVKLTSIGYAYTDRVKPINEQHLSDKQKVSSELLSKDTTTTITSATTTTAKIHATSDTIVGQTGASISAVKHPLDNFVIITPTQRDPALFIETGPEKHLLVGYDPSDDSFKALSYLTGKIGVDMLLLSVELYKDFLKKQETPISNTKQKEQHFFAFNKRVIVLGLILLS